MKYNRLGTSGLFVSELSFGTMTLGEMEGQPTLGGLTQRDAGALSGKQPRGAAAPEGSRRAAAAFPPVDYDRAYDALEVMRGVAERHSASAGAMVMERGL